MQTTKLDVQLRALTSETGPVKKPKNKDFLQMLSDGTPSPLIPIPMQQNQNFQSMFSSFVDLLSIIGFGGQNSAMNNSDKLIVVKLKERPDEADPKKTMYEVHVVDLQKKEQKIESGKEEFKIDDAKDSEETPEEAVEESAPVEYVVQAPVQAQSQVENTEEIDLSEQPKFFEFAGNQAELQQAEVQDKTVENNSQAQNLYIESLKEAGDKFTLSASGKASAQPVSAEKPQAQVTEAVQAQSAQNSKTGSVKETTDLKAVASVSDAKSVNDLSDLLSVKVQSVSKTEGGDTQSQQLLNGQQPTMNLVQTAVPTGTATEVDKTQQTSSIQSVKQVSEKDPSEIIGSSKEAKAGAKAASTAKASTVKPSRQLDHIERIVRAAKLFQSKSVSRLKIALEPSRLGSIKVDLTLKNNSLKVSVEAQSQATRDLIQSQMTELKQALEGYGIKISEMEVFTRQGSNESSGGYAAPSDSGKFFNNEEVDRHNRDLVEPAQKRPMAVVSKETIVDVVI